MELEEFIKEQLDGDRVLYDSDEVEEFITKAWIASLENSELKMLSLQILKVIALMDQEQARFNDLKKLLEEPSLD